VRGVAAGDPGPGSLALGELIDEYGAALTWDLWKLGIDIRALIRGDSHVSPRLVLTLVGQLPEDSAYMAARADAEPEDTARPAKPPSWRGWTYDRWLLADIRDLLAGANWQRGGSQGRKPTPTQRPARRAPTARDRIRAASRPTTSPLRRR
jgi:hypothetical protein